MIYWSMFIHLIKETMTTQGEETKILKMKSAFSERNRQAVLRENSMFLSSFHENNRNVSVAHCQEPKCSWIIWISEAKKIKIKFKLNYLHSSPELVVLLFRRRNANRKSDNHVWRWWANFSSQNQIIKSLCFGFAYKMKPKYVKLKAWFCFEIILPQFASCRKYLDPRDHKCK